MRMPQLTSLQAITCLTLFGKSAAAAQHGHRLAAHLPSIANLKFVSAGYARLVAGWLVVW